MELRQQIDNIIIHIIQLPRGKTVAHSDYRDAILDAVIAALPKGYAKPINDYPITESFKKSYTEAVDDINDRLQSAKGQK